MSVDERLKAVGAWSAEPFGNDRALDLLEELAELDDAAKAARLSELFAEGIASTPGDVPLSHEVVAAAALIALALPGGAVSVGEYLEGDDAPRGDFDPDAEENADDEWTPALLRSPSAQLISAAIASVLHMTSESSEWRRIWVSDGDRDEAIGRTMRVVAVLERAIG